MNWRTVKQNERKSHYFVMIEVNRCISPNWLSSLCGSLIRHKVNLILEGKDAEKSNRCKRCELILNKEVQS